MRDLPLQIEEALTRIAGRALPAPPDYSPRTGDYRLLFDCFSLPALAERCSYVSNICVQGHLLRSYPGLTRHLELFQQEQLQDQEIVHSLGVAEGWLLGDEIDPLAATDPTWADFTNACSNCTAGRPLGVRQCRATVCLL